MQGIYMIRNIKNDKKYVGSSVHIEERWKQHQKMLRENNHHSFKLQSAYNRFGVDNFEYSVLEEVESKEMLLVKEKEWIDKYDSFYSGYNSVDIGTGITAKQILREENRVKRQIYYNLFWNIYDAERIHISSKWLERLKNPEYYDFSTLRRICVMINFAYENSMENTVSYLRMQHKKFRIGITQVDGQYVDYIFKKVDHKYVPYFKFVYKEKPYEYEFNREELLFYKKEVFQYELKDILPEQED